MSVLGKSKAACDPCRFIHKRCSGELPCVNCELNKKECYFNATKSSRSKRNYRHIKSEETFSFLDDNLRAAFLIFNQTRKYSSYIDFDPTKIPQTIQKTLNEILTWNMSQVTVHSLTFDLAIYCSALSYGFLEQNPTHAKLYAYCAFNYFNQYISVGFSLTSEDYSKKCILLDHLTLQIRYWITIRDSPKVVFLIELFKTTIETIDRSVYIVPAHFQIYSSAVMVWLCRDPIEKEMHLRKICFQDILDAVDADTLMFLVFCVVCDRFAYDNLGKRITTSNFSTPIVESLMSSIGELISYRSLVPGCEAQAIYKTGFDSLKTLFAFRSYSIFMEPDLEPVFNVTWQSLWLIGLTLSIYVEVGNKVQQFDRLKSLLYVSQAAKEVWDPILGSEYFAQHIEESSTTASSIAETTETVEDFVYNENDYDDLFNNFS